MFTALIIITLVILVTEALFKPRLDFDRPTRQLTLWYYDLKTGGRVYKLIAKL